MKTYLEPEEIILVEQAVSNLRDKILIRLLFHLGCRVSEAPAIKVESIDFTRDTITIIYLKSRERNMPRTMHVRDDVTCEGDTGAAYHALRILARMIAKDYLARTGIKNKANQREERTNDGRKEARPAKSNT